MFPDLVSGYEEYHVHVETGHAVRADLIAPWIEPGSKVLDAGCGDGLMAELLQRRLGVSIEGLDIAQAAVDKTRSRGVRANVHDFDSDPTLPSGFDYILFIEVLEHLRSPHMVLTNAAKSARKAVLVTIPNSAWIGYRFHLLGGHAPIQSFTHLHMWSHIDFMAFCRKLGLGSPDARFLASRGGLRKRLIARWPNLLAHQLAYRIPSRPV